MDVMRRSAASPSALRAAHQSSAVARFLLLALLVGIVAPRRVRLSRHTLHRSGHRSAVSHTHNVENVESAPSSQDQHVPARACAAPPPAVCGLKLVNATTQQLYAVRLRNRELELQLRGFGSLKRGDRLIRTTVDHTGDIFPGAVMRLGDAMPLLVSGDASAAGIPLADPYDGPDIAQGTLFAVNMQLTPGLYDAVRGQAAVAPTHGVSAAASIPITIVAAGSKVGTPGAAVSTLPVGVLQPGDHIAVAGFVGAVAQRIAPVSGKRLSSSVVSPFRLQAAFPFADAHSQRVFRFLPSDPPAFPGVSDRLLAAWLKRRSPREAAPDDTLPIDDADELIARISGEADSLFPTADIDAANAAATSSLMAIAIPGAADLESGSAHIAAAGGFDFRPFLAPGAVVKIGGRGPLVLSPTAPVTAAGFELEAVYPGAAERAAAVERLPDVRPLPLRFTLAPDGMSLSAAPPSEATLQSSLAAALATARGEHVPPSAASATSGGGDGGAGAAAASVNELLSFVAPGDVLLLMTSPMRFAVVAGVAGGGSGADAALRIRLAAAVELPEQKQGQPSKAGAGSSAAADAAGPSSQRDNIRVFYAGFRRAEGCTVSVAAGASVATVSGCDARTRVRPADELFIGDPTNGGPWRAYFDSGMGDSAAVAAALKGAVAGKSGDGDAPAPASLASKAAVMPLMVAAQEGSASDAVSATSIRLAAPYSGSAAIENAPLYRSGAQQLPGTVSVMSAQAVATVEGFDARALVQSGDVLTLGALLPTIVAGGALPVVDLQAPPVPVGKDAAIARAAQPPSAAAAGPSAAAAGVDRGSFYLREAIAVPPLAKVRARKLPLRLLTARVAFGGGSSSGSDSAAAAAASPASNGGAPAVLFTASDLRLWVGPATPLAVGAYAHLLPAQPYGDGSGSSSSSSGSGGADPAAPPAVQLAHRLPPDFPVGPSRVALAWAPPALPVTAAPLSIQGGAVWHADTEFTPAAPGGAFALSRCPTLPALSPLAAATLTDAARAALRAWSEGCVASLPPSDNRVWLPAYVDTSDAGLLPPVSFGAEELAYKQLPGTVAVIAGSAIVSSTADLTGYMAAGDVVVIGALQLLPAPPGLAAGLTGVTGSSSSAAAAAAGARTPSTYTIAAPASMTAFRLTAPHPGPTASGLPLLVQYRRVRLSSALDVTFGSPTAATHRDIRGEVAAGDTIEIVSSLGANPGGATGGRIVREFVVVPPLTDSSITLSEAYPGANEAGCAAFRLVGGSGPGVLLPGTVSVTEHSDLVRSTEDLSGSVRAGDRLRIATLEVQAAEPITPQGFALAAAYAGTSATGLRAYNLGRTSQARTLEQLGRLKMGCRSVFCLAKIEEMERAIPTDITRSLNAAALLPPGGGAGGSATVDRDEVLAKQAEAEAAVEREWRDWFGKAQAQLGLVDAGKTSGTGAPAAPAAPAAGGGGAPAPAAGTSSTDAAAGMRLTAMDAESMARAKGLATQGGRTVSGGKFQKRLGHARSGHK